MFYLLSIGFGLISLISADTGDHSGHQHTSDDIYDCECTTGITTNNLDCDDIDEHLDGLQKYLSDNDCDQYCMNFMFHGNTEVAFRCFQVFTILVQHHDYCESGTVNETLFHHYLEKCPDCLQQHHYVAGAEECDGGLNCTDTDAQENDVQYILDHCVSACNDSQCNSTWKTVQGYHRMCAHNELSEEFDSLYDQAAFSKTVCNSIECNVPWEANYTVNCSNSNNMPYMILIKEFGDLDIDELLDESKGMNYLSIPSLFIVVGYVLIATLI